MLVTVLLVVFAHSASAQGLGDLKGIGPSTAEVVGAAVGVAAVTGIVLYLVLHKPSITGCVQSANGMSSLIDKQDNLNYTLVDENSVLQAGHRLKLSGRKKKSKDGSHIFRVKKMKQDYGPCEASS